MTGAEIDSARPVPLSFTYPLRQREAAHGFASRLAALNGRDLASLLHHRALTHVDINRGAPETIRFIAAMGGTDPDRLLHQAVIPTGQDRRWRVVGEDIGPNVIHRSFYRFCPHCILEDLREEYGPLQARPWLRIEWVLGYFRSCNRHQTILVRVGTPDSYHRAFDFNETLAGTLDELPDIAAKTQRHAASPYHDWIVARIEGRRDPDNWLDTLPLHVGALWCENLGRSVQQHSTTSKKLSDLEAAVACDEGFRIASQGEKEILNALNRLNMVPRRPTGPIRPIEVYGYAFRVLQRTMDEAEFEPVRRLFRDFVMRSRHWPLGTEILGHIVEKRVVATVTSAAQAAGVNAKTMREIFRRQGLAAEHLDQGLGHRSVEVPIEQVDTLLRKMTNSLSLKETTALLGVERKFFQGILKTGALPHVFGGAARPGQFGRYAQEDIDAFLARLFEGAIEVATPGDFQRSIEEARIAARANSFDVMKLVIDRKVKWKGRISGRSDFQALLVDIDEIKQLLNDGVPANTHLKIKEVAKFVEGLQKDAVRPLCDLHQFHLVTGYSPIARRVSTLITLQSAEDFRHRYITAGEISRVHGVTPARVMYRLRKAGVATAFDQDLVHCLIYERELADRAIRCIEDIWGR